jgi:hypothetical protein
MGSDAPRWVALLSAWANVFAAITLIISFSVYFIALQLGHCDPRTCTTASAANHAIVFNGRGEGHDYYMVAKWMMFTEGVCWWLAGALLCYRNICNENAAGAVSQCIIATGGFFFTCSAFGNPANIISLRYIVPITYWIDEAPSSGSAGTTWVSFADVCPYYGIACFMVATSMGMYSVRGLPKNSIVSPFYGVLCFFLGAWTIGVITLFLPMLAGGETKWEDVNVPPCIDGIPGIPFNGSKQCVLDMPTFAWYQLKIFSVMGALFLFSGAMIFGVMDNLLCLPVKDNKLLAADGAEA